MGKTKRATFDQVRAFINEAFHQNFVADKGYKYKRGDIVILSDKKITVDFMVEGIIENDGSVPDDYYFRSVEPAISPNSGMVYEAYRRVGFDDILNNKENE